MSFDIYVPCNCTQEYKTNFPPFKDKLYFTDGCWYLKSEFDCTIWENNYDKWVFCEHNQYALYTSMGQSIIHWKEYVYKKYGQQFKHLVAFFPDSNGYVNLDYDKNMALSELNRFIDLEDKKQNSRFNKFKEILETALQWEQDIYWC